MLSKDREPIYNDPSEVPLSRRDLLSQPLSGIIKPMNDFYQEQRKQSEETSPQTYLPLQTRREFVATAVVAALGAKIIFAEKANAEVITDNSLVKEHIPKNANENLEMFYQNFASQQRKRDSSFNDSSLLKSGRLTPQEVGFHKFQAESNKYSLLKRDEQELHLIAFQSELQSDPDLIVKESYTRDELDPRIKVIPGREKEEDILFGDMMPDDQKAVNKYLNILYEKYGIIAQKAMGNYIGTFYLKDSEGNYHAFICGDKSILKAGALDILQTPLMSRDRARGAWTLNQNDTSLFKYDDDPTGERWLRASQWPIVGDQNNASFAPILLHMQEKNHLTIYGNQNQAASLVGQEVQCSVLDKDAVENTLSPDLPKVPIVATINGHNVSQDMWNFLAQDIGETWLMQYGNPISEQFEVKAFFDGTRRPVWIQVFERRTVTIDPNNPNKNFQKQGGLDTLEFIYALTGKYVRTLPIFEPIPAPSPEPTPPPTDGKPTAEQLAQSPLIDSAEATINNKTYTVETRATTTSTQKITIRPELKDQLMKVIGEDGENAGYTKAEIIVLDSVKIPYDISTILPNGVLTSNTEIVRNGNTINMGYTAIQHEGDTMYFYYIPNIAITPDNPNDQFRSLDWSLSDKFLSDTITGGTGDANIDDYPDHTALRNQFVLTDSQR